MKPDYDLNVNPRWPNITEDATLRARRIAMMYRATLRAHSPELSDDCDNTARQFGETWMLDREDTIDPERELTTAEAAELINVAPKTIRNWACMDHPDNPHQKLLPRFKKRGREMTYLAQNVLAARTAVLRAQHTDTQS